MSRIQFNNFITFAENFILNVPFLFLMNSRNIKASEIDLVVFLLKRFYIEDILYMSDSFPEYFNLRRNTVSHVENRVDSCYTKLVAW
jgi:hypothetical protein